MLDFCNVFVWFRVDIFESVSDLVLVWIFLWEGVIYIE